MGRNSRTPSCAGVGNIRTIGQRHQVEQEIERQPVAAEPSESPDQPDRRRRRMAPGTVIADQDPGVVPGQAVLVGLAEVDDPDVGQRTLAVAC